MLPNATPARRILIVDDDAVLVSAIAQVLRNVGYVTAQASSGQEAIELAHRFVPDLAILDIVMEGMSGLELAHYLHTGTDIAFMFISGHTETEIIKQAAEYGAVGYLLKPFTIPQIIPALEAALARADEIRLLRQGEKTLISSLNTGRETGMAIGLLMARFQTDRNTAFEVLRSYARSRRCKLNVVVEQLLAAEELISSFKILFVKAEMKADLVKSDK